MRIEPLSPGPVELTDEDRRHLFRDGEQRPIIASVSGGKDSGAMALWLLEQGLEIDAVFLDTGWEHPSTYDYLRGALAAAIGEITWLTPQRSMAELVRHKSMFPSRTRRFCTADLKLAPFERHISAHYAPGAVVNVIGVRAEESRARATLPRWSCEDGDRMFVDTWRPLIAWREDDVYAIHARHALKLNPLYGEGAARVGCWPCIYARRGEIRKLADIDPARIARIRQLEREVGSTFFYERGGAGAVDIDTVVAWARAGEGDERFDPGDGNRGCMRWGLCDFAAADAETPAARAPEHSHDTSGADDTLGDDTLDDALSWMARGYRSQLGSDMTAARAAYRRALEQLPVGGARVDEELRARVHANLALVLGGGSTHEAACGADELAARASARAAEHWLELAEARRDRTRDAARDDTHDSHDDSHDDGSADGSDTRAALAALLAAFYMVGERDLPRADALAERAVRLGRSRWRPARRALRMRIAALLGRDDVADLEGRRGLQENPWHPALRHELERRNLISGPARRPVASAALSPAGLEPIGY